MSDDTKYKEGAIPVDHSAEVTPVTKKSIDKIDASTWEDMTFESLSVQYNMLQKRIDMANSMGRSDLTKQMQHGLKYILQLMEDKKTKTNNNKGLFI